jgi:PBSX family phage portal protein
MAKKQKFHAKSNSNQNGVVVSGDEPRSTYSIDPNYEVVDRDDWLTHYDRLYYNQAGDYWQPPISRRGLAKIANANAYHGSLLKARSNYVVARFISGGNMKGRELQAAVYDYLLCGDVAFVKLRNRLDRVVGLAPIPSIYLRQRRNGDFCQLLRSDDSDYFDGEDVTLYQKDYAANDVIFLPQYDPQQQIYGLPDYMGGLQSALLNRDATLFRRRYYKNGAHMGFIFYATDPNLSVKDEEELKKKIASSKGVGNFQSMFVNVPNGSEKGIQLIPVGDIATKDEFERIKNITAQDVLTSHRFPTGKAGIIPQGVKGADDPLKVDWVYTKDETLLVCKLIMDEVNNDPDMPKALHFNFDLNNELATNV